jgi:hypothetical protein
MVERLAGDADYLSEHFVSDMANFILCHPWHIAEVLEVNEGAKVKRHIQG